MHWIRSLIPQWMAKFSKPKRRKRPGLYGHGEILEDRIVLSGFVASAAGGSSDRDSSVVTFVADNNSGGSGGNGGGLEDGGGGKSVKTLTIRNPNANPDVFPDISLPPIPNLEPEDPTVRTGNLFIPFPGYRGDLLLAAGDYDGDGEDELAISIGRGGYPHIKIFDVGQDGAIAETPSFEFFAYFPPFFGGVNIVAGDFNGDGRDELVTAPVADWGPHVKIFAFDGVPGTITGVRIQEQFFAYTHFHGGGVTVAAGDLDNDGVDELVTGTGRTGGPYVRVFDNLALDGQFRLVHEDVALIVPFNDLNFFGGINVTVAQLHDLGDDRPQIIVSRGSDGPPDVWVYAPNGPSTSDGYSIFDQFSVYGSNFLGGVRLGNGNLLDNEGNAELIAANGPTGGPLVRVLGPDGILLDVSLSDPNLTTGLVVTAGDFTAEYRVTVNVPGNFSYNNVEGTLEVFPTLPAQNGSNPNDRDIRFIVPNRIQFATNRSLQGLDPLDIIDVDYVEFDEFTSRITVTIEQVFLLNIPYTNTFRLSFFGQEYSIISGSIVIDLLNGGNTISGTFDFINSLSLSNPRRLTGTFNGTRID